MNALSKGHPQVKAFGFVSNMQEMMEVSDIVIGKGGGLTVTESFAKSKPLILFRSVMGQERRNDAIAEKYGAGFATSSVEEVVKKVSELASNPELFLRMKENTKKLSKPSASQAILSIVRDEC
jgi:processive 1,2-diacylglycerol beta-glucosyltransferase